MLSIRIPLTKECVEEDTKPEDHQTLPIVNKNKFKYADFLEALLFK